MKLIKYFDEQSNVFDRETNYTNKENKLMTVETSIKFEGNKKII